MYLQINTSKYDADQEIMNIYENLQIVWSQFFTDMLLFVNILSTSNIYQWWLHTNALSKAMMHGDSYLELSCFQTHLGIIDI